MFNSKFLGHPDRNSSDTDLTHRSKLFTRRAAIRQNVRPAQSSSDAHATVAVSETTMALALAAEVRTQPDIRPVLNALALAKAEAIPDVPTATSTKKTQKSGRKRKNEVPGTPRRKRSSSKKSSVEVS